MKSKYIAKPLKNKEMNAETYKLRRQVINLIYEAKRLVPELPRIEVRVTDNDKFIRGKGAPGKRIIWITERYVARRETVFHEILHAIGMRDHVDGCPLMGRSSQDMAKEKCDELFVKYAKKLLA